VGWALEAPPARAAFPLTCLAPFLGKLSSDTADRLAAALGQALAGAAALNAVDAEGADQLQAFLAHLKVIGMALRLRVARGAGAPACAWVHPRAASPAACRPQLPWRLRAGTHKHAHTRTHTHKHSRNAQHHTLNTQRARRSAPRARR
jgi:hypothetical protein